MSLWIAAAALALQPAAGEPDLDWMAGYWLSCGGGQDVAETWSERRGGIMLGTSITTGDDAFGWEQMRIEAGLPEGSLAFIAQPRGASAPVAFRLVRSGPREAVFENRAHDYPQRVIYRRAGNRLTGRIEAADGTESMEWRFRAAPLNTRCPRVRARRR